MTIVDELPAVGLTMAFTSALGNVLGEVLRKRLVGSYNPGTVTVAYRLPTAVFIGIVIVIMMRSGASPRVVDHGPIFGVWHLAPITGFLVYALVVTLILGIATWMHLKAFAVGELSTTAPILSFTPVFAVFTGWVAFHNVLSAAKLIGIAMASIPPVFMQTLRRAEVLIIVLMGWLIFKEKRIARKFLGSSIMVIGVIIIIVRNLTLTQTLWLAATGLAILIPLSLLAPYGERRAGRYDADTKQARSSTATPESGPLV
jgi:drug/metabolite transporter (DMT)-like permease